MVAIGTIEKQLPDGWLVVKGISVQDGPKFLVKSDSLVRCITRPEKSLKKKKRKSSEGRRFSMKALKMNFMDEVKVPFR